MPIAILYDLQEISKHQDAPHASGNFLKILV